MNKMDDYEMAGCPARFYRAFQNQTDCPVV